MLRVYNNPGQSTVELIHGNDCYTFGWDLREVYGDDGELENEYIEYTPVYLNGEFYLPIHFAAALFPAGYDCVSGILTFDELLNMMIRLKSAHIRSTFQDDYIVFLDSLHDEMKVAGIFE